MIKKYTISVIGTGYVGLPMATSFASLGHKVFCVDKDNSKLETLKNGKITIFENGLEELFTKVQKKNPMEFTSDTCEAIIQSDIIFIAVGTPMNNDGSVDMRFIWSTADDLASCIDSKKVIVIKSTVPPGATIGYKEYLEKKSGKKNLKVAFMPEFLKEGHALEDFMHPDRTIIGTEEKKSISNLKELFSFTKTPVLVCDTKTAELVKYTANTYLATKISFINEISQICDSIGADVDMVSKGIGLDDRIGPKFLNASIGYGGSCFPKDVSALRKFIKKDNIKFRILNAVMLANESQKNYFVHKIEKNLGNVRGKKLGILGLAFKANTDDIRKSPAIEVVKKLIKKGAKITAYDPMAMSNSRKVLSKINYADSIEDAIKGKDALVILTEWAQFKTLNLVKAKKLLKKPIIFDGRNLFDRDVVKKKGFKYYSIGRKDQI